MNCLETYSGLLREVFGRTAKFESDALAWRYRDNPAGAVVGTDAWDGDRLAAHYVTCPITALVEGELRQGLLSLNTATHPDYRGRGLFTELAHRTFERAAAQGYSFVIGVANASSTPGFVRKLGFQSVSPLAAGLVLNDPRRMRQADCQYQAYWSTAALNWRLSNPAARYFCGSSGDLYGVWADTGVPFLRCAAYLEVSGRVASRRPLGLSLFIGLDSRISISRHGFIPVPSLWRPSPLNLIWRSLSSGTATVLRSDEIAFNFLDFDPY